MTDEPTEKVVISHDHYIKLLSDSLTLQRLREAGVDNWEGYNDAIFGERCGRPSMRGSSRG